MSHAAERIMRTCLQSLYTRIILAAIAVFVVIGAALFSARSRDANAVRLEHNALEKAVLGERSLVGSPSGIATKKPIFNTASMSLGGQEVAGFSAKVPTQSKPDEPAAPAGLKPEETQTWLAMAKRRGSDAKQTLESFYPASYGDAFVVEGDGVRVALRPVGGAAVAATVEDGNIIYRGAYTETDSKHIVTDGRSEEFLYLQSGEAPREFEYEISETTPGTNIKLVNGEVLFTDAAGHGVRIEAPWVKEANGNKRTDAIGWELRGGEADDRPCLYLKLTDTDLQYPLVIDPTWSVTGDLNTARFQHTATLLPNGKVLVAGGNNGSALTSSELYDPAAGTWAPTTGPLNTARSQHTATLLPNGKVLVAGGVNNGSALTSSELYDPAAGTWAPTTGPLNIARYQHTATLLPNGNVLVAGGTNSGNYSLTSSELYDPAAGTWAATTGPLNTARHVHTATLLPNGNVLVAGGAGGNSGYLTSSELYDPAVGTWAATTGPLNTARYRDTATLLPNGKVLVAGGAGNSTSSELYDLAAGTWAAAGNLNTARLQHTATLLPNGKVLVAGGFGNSGYLTSSELYDPATPTPTPTPSPTPSPTPPQLYGDVAPRPNGDGSLTAPDVIIERQFVVGLQTPSANEFMRADCAPRATHGDGLLTAGDTIQVRRYIAGLDSIDQLPGTIEARPLNDQSDKAGMKLKSVWTQRVISVVQAEQPPQGKVVLYVQMDRQGDEAAAAFTLGFDPATLSNPVISLGSGASSGTILTTNTSKSDSGQLAVLVDSDEALASGRVVSVTFDVAQNVAGETTPVTFTDAITQGSTADAEGNLLPTRFVDGVLTLPEAASPALEISGRVLTPDGRGLRNAVVVLTDSNGVERYVPTSSFGYYHFDSLTNSATYVIGVKSKRYSFELRVVQALDNVTDVDFQAR